MILAVDLYIAPMRLKSLSLLKFGTFLVGKYGETREHSAHDHMTLEGHLPLNFLLIIDFIISHQAMFDIFIISLTFQIS